MAHPRGIGLGWKSIPGIPVSGACTVATAPLSLQSEQIGAMVTPRWVCQACASTSILIYAQKLLSDVGVRSQALFSMRMISGQFVKAVVTAYG